MKDKLRYLWKNKGIRCFGIAFLLIVLVLGWYLRTGGDSFSFSVERTERIPSGVLTEAADLASASESEDAEEEPIVCEIDGAVERPGVYQLPPGSRIADLVQVSGGLSEDADTRWLNRAERLSDGLKIYVPRVEEEDPAPTVSRSASASDAPAKIDLNRADAAELETLKGIGPVTAAKIIDYRKKAGPFRSIEEIMNVSGIGEKTFLAIRDRITVN